MKNISFFLIPKQDVVYLPYIATVRQALEKMEHHRYTAIPIVDIEGKYIGTITEGDLLWKIKNTANLHFDNCHKSFIADVPLRVKNKPVRISAQMDDLIELVANQNFVPVLDDEDVFIGIVRRREIIEYCSHMLKKRKDN